MSAQVNGKDSAKQIRRRAYDCSRNHVAEWRDKAVALRVIGDE